MQATPVTVELTRYADRESPSRAKARGTAVKLGRLIALSRGCGAASASNFETLQSPAVKVTCAEFYHRISDLVESSANRTYQS